MALPSHLGLGGRSEQRLRRGSHRSLRASLRICPTLAEKVPGGTKPHVDGAGPAELFAVTGEPVFKQRADVLAGSHPRRMKRADRQMGVLPPNPPPFKWTSSGSCLLTCSPSRIVGFLICPCFPHRPRYDRVMLGRSGTGGHGWEAQLRNPRYHPVLGLSALACGSLEALLTQQPSVGTRSLSSHTRTRALRSPALEGSHCLESRTQAERGRGPWRVRESLRVLRGETASGSVSVSGMERGRPGRERGLPTSRLPCLGQRAKGEMGPGAARGLAVRDLFALPGHSSCVCLGACRAPAPS